MKGLQYVLYLICDEMSTMNNVKFTMRAKNYYCSLVSRFQAYLPHDAVTCIAHM